MRILHVNNIANIANILAREQRNRGEDATVLSLGPSSYGFDFDEQARGFIGLLRRARKIVQGYDVIHLHSSSLLPAYLDAPLTRLVGKTVVYHHHGSDIRGKGCPALASLHARHVVATPDLLRYCPRAVWLPNPVDTRALRPAPLPVPFSLASGYKDEEAIRQALHGQAVDVIRGVPHAHVLARLRHASLFIDNFTFGTYSYLATEALALGRPVALHLHASVEKKLPSPHPFLRCTPKNLPQTISALRAAPARLRAAGRASRAYAVRVHDVRHVVNQLEKIYLSK